MRNIVLVMICMLFLPIVGCGSNNEGEINSKTVMVAEVQDENQAREVLLDKLDVSSDESEYSVNLLREAKLGNETIYAFERVGLKGGAASVYFVDSKGLIYNSSEELLVDYFKSSNNKEQFDDGQYLNTDMYYIEMKSINDPEVITWETYIVNEVGYPDVDSAVKAVVINYVANDPILSLLGKDVSYIEKTTGQKAQKVVIPDVDGIEDMISTEINYKGANITFFGGKTATDIFYSTGQELLGVKIGYTFEEIIEVLGSPLTIEPDPYFDDVYKMTYDFFDVIYVEFYAESENGNTASALVKAL